MQTCQFCFNNVSCKTHMQIPLQKYYALHESYAILAKVHNDWITSSSLNYMFEPKMLAIIVKITSTLNKQFEQIVKTRVNE